MVSEIKNKSWFRRHWIISMILGLVILFAIGIMFGEGELSDDEYESPNQLKTYVNEDLYELIVLFVNDDYYTDLQKKEEFKQYKNKWIKSSGSVMEIDDVIMSSNIVVGIINPDNIYLRGATIYFKSSEKDKLLEIDKYSEISFEGRIEDYGSFMGIIIKDAVVR